MRLSAYKVLIDSAKELPEELFGTSYFKKTKFIYNPKRLAVEAILKKARKDTSGLFHTEFIELFKYARK